MDQNLLRYRRQFVLSTEQIEVFPDWQTGTVAGRYPIAVHPELNFLQLSEGRVELTLLGYLIDPHHIEWEDADILGWLLSQAKDLESLLKATYSLSGRWLIFFDNGDHLVAFHDPCGLRSLYYTNDRVEPFMCASQPGLIASALGLEYSEEAKRDYLETRAYTELLEYWLPGGATLYDEIVQLMANHYLDILTRRQHRYWPWAPIQPVEYERAVDQGAMLMENLVMAASRRFQLALPVTSGYDTRLLVAATRSIRSQVYYYTLAIYDWDRNSADVAVPHRLITSLGMEHHILDCHAPMDEDFKRTYMGNVDLAHPAWGDIAFGIHAEYPQDRVAVKGSCSEISRCHHYKYQYPDVINGERLTMFAKMQGSPFAVKHFSRWYEESLPVARQNNVDILDLFYWEHRMGSWQPMSQLEWDIVQEEFTPFACREYHSVLMGVDNRHRRPPGYRMYRDMMQRLWPEVLNEPINPKPFWGKIKKEYPRLIQGTPAYQFSRRLYKRLRGK